MVGGGASFFHFYARIHAKDQDSNIVFLCQTTYFPTGFTAPVACGKEYECGFYTYWIIGANIFWKKIYTCFICLLVQSKSPPFWFAQIPGVLILLHWCILCFYIAHNCRTCPKKQLSKRGCQATQTRILIQEENNQKIKYIFFSRLTVLGVVKMINTWQDFQVFWEICFKSVLNVGFTIQMQSRRRLL